MNKIQTCGLLAVFAFASSALAQAPTTPSAQDPAQDTAQRDPRPSTSRTEGTAADSTAPGETPTRSTRQDVLPPPGPATSPTEGTAADTTPPDRASGGGTMKPELVGLEVVSPSDASLGKVVDVVFDSRGQPDYVVIASQGNNAAVPYSTASTMVEGDKVVMEQSRLQGAPKIEQGAWRGQSNRDWKDDAKRYWDQG